MKHTLTGLLALTMAALSTGCTMPAAGGPPKTVDEKKDEARQGKVPDPLRDPRPDMPGTGPLFQPMR